MTDPYSILGVSPSATDEEIKAAYKSLVKKYHPDNYDDGNPLKELATEKMQQINSAYDEILRLRAGGASSSGGSNGNQSGYNGSPIYREIRIDINARRFADAEKKLYAILEDQRVAEWHYLLSVVLMQRNRVNDAMRELEIACNMDPANLEYQRAKEMFNQRAGAYGANYYGSAGYAPRRDATSDACDCCANLICLDCLCECMGGDLIRCI